MNRDELLEIAQELVVLRFFMATAFSTCAFDKKTAKVRRERMRRLEQLEELLRTEAAKWPNGTGS
jgi:hypothetical protein